MVGFSVCVKAAAFFFFLLTENVFLPLLAIAINLNPITTILDIEYSLEILPDYFSYFPVSHYRRDRFNEKSGD